MAGIILIILWLGLFPQTIINTAEPALTAILERAGVALNETGKIIVSPDMTTHAQTSNILKMIQGSGPNR